MFCARVYYACTYLWGGLLLLVRGRPGVANREQRRCTIKTTKEIIFSLFETLNAADDKSIWPRNRRSVAVVVWWCTDGRWLWWWRVGAGLGGGGVGGGGEGGNGVGGLQLIHDDDDGYATTTYTYTIANCYYYYHYYCCCYCYYYYNCRIRGKQYLIINCLCVCAHNGINVKRVGALNRRSKTFINK